MLNFKIFSFRNAIKLPIIVYGRYGIIHFTALQKGQIVLKSPCRTGLIRLNRKIGDNIGNKLRGSLCLEGTIVLKGECDIGQGCSLVIRKGACLEIGDKLSVTGSSKIHVYECVKLGSRVIISWNAHIHDTDYHYYINNNRIFQRNRQIEIGDNVWLGHDVTISKGSVIPSNCIVASHSMVNRKFIECAEGLLLAGIPAQIVKCNVRPINDYCKDAYIDSCYNNLDDRDEGISPSLFDL